VGKVGDLGRRGGGNISTSGMLRAAGERKAQGQITNKKQPVWGKQQPISELLGSGGKLKKELHKPGKSTPVREKAILDCTWKSVWTWSAVINTTGGTKIPFLGGVAQLGGKGKNRVRG